MTYADPTAAVRVELEAFSPFIPLNAADSALPCTLLHYTVHNTSDQQLAVEIAGWLENAVCPDEMHPLRLVRRNVIDGRGFQCSAAYPPEAAPLVPNAMTSCLPTSKPDDAPWRPAGKAFGETPFNKSQLPPFHKLANFSGDGFVNTHDVRQTGPNSRQADQLQGTLTSPEFEITRHYIAFLIAGGSHQGQTELRLRIGEDDSRSVIAACSGRNDAQMRREYFDVREHEGQQASLEIVDQAQGSWGHICVDQIVFTDRPPGHDLPLEQLPGYGTLALKCLGDEPVTVAHLEPGTVDAERVFSAMDGQAKSSTSRRIESPADRRPATAAMQGVELEPGESKTLTFVMSWHFPHFAQVSGEMSAITGLANLKRHYATRFADATAVADYVREHYERLTNTTRLWKTTWYDSTLPYWLLDRVMVSADCLATTTLYWFDSGRVWAWEGTDCCPGTCQHVWNYAQAMARLFPELESSLRRDVDFGLAWHENGAIDYRSESARHVAHDGLCGTIMRVWREHTLSADDAFLREVWPRVKQSTQFLIDFDGDRNGLLEAAQYNTLDQAWVGPMGWISSMYLGALAAAAAMAAEMEDERFANTCREILARGQRNLVEQLFDGEYFIHKPPHFENTNTNIGCHIDQVLGQSWSWQYGLPRVVPQPQTVSALQALWKYNFTPDAGGYRNKMQAVIQGGRWYAMPGEAGLLMTTWPRGGADKRTARGRSSTSA